MSRFGVLAVITSDHGTQFTSSLWASLCILLNIQHNQTTAYHPQSNGMVECFHRRLKDTLHARSASANWVDHLPWVLLGLRAAAREDDSSTPAQIQHHRRLPPHLPDDLARAPTVFMRRDNQVPPLQPLYNGPYAVIRRSLHHFTLRISDKEDKVSTLRLKPCTDPTAPPAQPRVRGQPPAAVTFRDFPPPGAAAARRVHFSPKQQAEPRREPFSPGLLPMFLHVPPPFSTTPPLGPPATTEHRPD